MLVLFDRYGYITTFTWDKFIVPTVPYIDFLFILTFTTLGIFNLKIKQAPFRTFSIATFPDIVFQLYSDDKT